MEACDNAESITHIRLVIILAIMIIIVTQLTTCVKQSVTLVVNILMILLIHLVATDHPVIAVESSIQDEGMVKYCYEGKCEKSSAERREDFHPASHFHGRH